MYKKEVTSSRGIQNSFVEPFRFLFNKQSDLRRPRWEAKYQVTISINVLSCDSQEPLKTSVHSLSDKREIIAFRIITIHFF